MQLCVVTWVLRHHPALHSALPHLGSLVSDFLGPDPNLSLAEACELGSTGLLDWLWERSCTSADARPEGWSLCNFLRSEPYYYRYQLYEAIQVAARQGDVSVVTWLMDHFSGCEVPSEAVAAAAFKGHLPVLQLLLEKDAGRGRPHKSERVELENSEWVDSVPVMPAEWSGPGNVVRWGGDSIHHAVAAGKIEVARWLYDNTPHQSGEDDIHRIVERAVGNGDFEFAEYLMPRRRKIGDYVIQFMGRRAPELMLERGYLKENKVAAVGAILVAARMGNLDLMKRIAAQHPKPPRGKNSEWLQFWEIITTTACEKGDVATIKWTMEHPTGRLLCKQMKEDAFMNRYDGLLQKAAEGGHIDALEYLVEQGCTDEYAHAMVNAARKGHLNCIEWLLEHTYQYHPRGSADRVLPEAAKLGYLGILKFFHAPLYTSEEMSPKRRKLEDSGVCDGCTMKAVENAIGNGNLRVASWLCWYYPEFVPTHNSLWMYPENLFDTLLFIQVNYPDVFTLEFGRGTKSDLADEYRKGSEILVNKWLDEKSPGRPTKQREVTFMWGM
ncbi:hypothetical protein PF008_g23454 [Phytophthora fragariae]|uniref:Uncharacterized protein n=1 Tax=Phytophthora fragariae TaxID=53985 RepID=A0A6G0QQQ8_9STRA|nr:hypothetical protein PF008_g23454 [Phytophthora fragariae]